MKPNIQGHKGIDEFFERYMIECKSVKWKAIGFPVPAKTVEYIEKTKDTSISYKKKFAIIIKSNNKKPLVITDDGDLPGISDVVNMFFYRLDCYVLGYKDYLGIIRERYGHNSCLLYTSPSPRDRQKSRMPSSA